MSCLVTTCDDWEILKHLLRQETRPTNEIERKIENVQTNLMTSLQKDQHRNETQLFQKKQIIGAPKIPQNADQSQPHSTRGFP